MNTNVAKRRLECALQPKRLEKIGDTQLRKEILNSKF